MFIMLLPADVRYFLSVLAFWPTAAIARIFSWTCPHRRRVWDRINDNIILGAAPFFRAELEALYHKQSVRGIVNMCREWDWHAAWYAKSGFAQMWLPTIDYDVPAFRDCVAGACFIEGFARAGATSYVHCKAGRGRSTAVVLAHLVLFDGMAPHDAHLLVKGKRPHISERWSAPEIQECWRLRREMEVEAFAELGAVRTSSSSSSGGGAAARPGELPSREALRGTAAWARYEARLAELGGRGGPDLHARLLPPTRSHEDADRARKLR